VLGSLSGASAAIGTTWISQRSQTRRDMAKSETSKRELLYSDFITEASERTADAFDHSLDNPETLVKLCNSRPYPARLVPTPSWPRHKNVAIALWIYTPNPTGQWTSSP
jgi:hypothetical protein